MLAFASLMIGQGVQHPAGLPIGLTVAGLHDAHQFSLQPPQPRDPIPDFDNPILRDAVRVSMGSLGHLLQRDQFGDGVEVEAQLPGMSDKGQPVKLGIAIAALPPGPCDRDRAEDRAPRSSGSSLPSRPYAATTRRWNAPASRLPLEATATVDRIYHGDETNQEHCHDRPIPPPHRISGRRRPRDPPLFE